MEIEAAGPVHAVLDGGLVSVGEGAKSLVCACVHACARALNGAAALVLHYTFEPGYATARRARIAVGSAAGQLARQSGDRFAGLTRVLEGLQHTLTHAHTHAHTPTRTHTRAHTLTHAETRARASSAADAHAADGAAPADSEAVPFHTAVSQRILRPDTHARARAHTAAHAGSRAHTAAHASPSRADMLLHTGETIAYQQQPTSANRWSPGLITESQLFLMVAIDAVCARVRVALAHVCGGKARVRRVSLPVVHAVEERPSRACCRGRPAAAVPSHEQRASCARYWRDAFLAHLPTDMLRAPPVLLSSVAAALQAAAPAEVLPLEPGLSTLDGALSHAGGAAVPLAELVGASGGAPRSPMHMDAPPHPDLSDVAPDCDPPSHAYWPMPALRDASAACRIIHNVCGFPVQTYAVRTVDGYIVTLIRIPRVESRKVAFFQHGLLDSASAWVSTGNVYSLAARAYQSGFDVFLGNLRGSNDALGINGFGANPVDYAEAMDVEDSAANDGLTGVLARMRSGSSDSARDVLQSQSAAAASPAGVAAASPAGATAASPAGAVGALTPPSSPPRAVSNATPFPSPLRGARSRMNSINLAVSPYATQDDAVLLRDLAEIAPPSRGFTPVASAASAVPHAPPHRRAPQVRVIGTSQDGIPVHETLHPRQREYWNFHSQDHALDVMAFMRQIRIIKALEVKQRRAAAARRGEDAIATDAQEPTPRARTRGARGEHGSPRSARSGSSVPDRTVDATSPDADDVRIAAVGHSMGGCVLIMYLLVARALRRPAFVDRAILLSPAGLHNQVGPIPRAMLMSMYFLGVFDAPAPFPKRSSTLQRFAARLLQDVKNSSATGDLMAVLGSYLFGGMRHRFVFRFVAISQYPVGGTNTRVIRHGIQAMRARDFCAYSYSPEDNEERYGSPHAPSYRMDYGLFNVPIDFVAGGRDMLVPPANIEEQFGLLDAVSPGLTTLQTFSDAGHLDFSLTLADDIISYVLRRLEQGAARPASTPPDAEAASTCERPNYVLKYNLASLVATARARKAAMGSLVDSSWKPARECAREFPWLAGFSKLEVVLDGLDVEAADMGLATHVLGLS